MLSILIHKILSLGLMMAAGFFLVRKGPLTEADSLSLSRLTVWLILPCSIFSAFQMDRTPEILRNLGLVLLAAAVLHGAMIALTALLRRPLHLNPVEQASVIYTNAGNLIIPLVSAMLGPEWVIYTSAFMLVMTVLTWTHGKILLCGPGSASPSAVVRNPSILALAAGVCLLLLDFHLPALLQDTVSAIGAMVGPVSMLVTGMLLAGSSLKAILSNRRIWLVTALRLLIYPLICLGLVQLLILVFPAGRDCFLITMMAASAPSASLITHICQLHGRDSGQASAICTVTTLLSALTIPAMVWLYLRLA